MSIICTRCGGTQVVCEATVNPNTKVITEISDDSLQFGRCETCKARSVLTDVEKTKAAIKSGFAGFVEANGRKWKSHATLTLLAKQDLPTFGYNMIDPLKSWCWGAILFYPFKISRFS